METKGFHKISATESYHPFYDKWWPQGHLLGWENTFVNQLHHFIDAILKSASLGKRMEIKY